MAANSAISRQLIAAARHLGEAVDRLKFADPVAYVYNPLSYARAPHEIYLRRFGQEARRVIFLGMNPGPFGMVQTGVPFVEVAAVRDWLRIESGVGKPAREHPLRMVSGFGCLRSEISGQRLWGLFAQRFGKPESFFSEHMVINYCPLAFLESSGRNRTPDKLPAPERAALFAVCDEHLRAVARALKAEWLIGIGDFAAKRAAEVFAQSELKLGKILHPSPASPAANRDWQGQATRQLQELGVWR
jgi:single-strand selective monofunctional uracil DNA glycosylase